MSLAEVQIGVEYYPMFDRGEPLFNADIYVGEPDTDSKNNQVPVTLREQDGTLVTVSQPINTGVGGVPTYNGSPVTLMAEGNYSVQVLDRDANQVYYMPNYYESIGVSILGTAKVFDNVEDMVDDLTLELGDTMQTLGYHSVADGGGNFYKAVAGGTGTVDGGTYINLDIGLQAFGIMDAGAINVKQFGAYGDGVEDDTAVFTTVFANYRNGSSIFLPKGTYNVDNISVKASAGLHVYGESRGATFINFTGASGIAFAFEQLSTEGGITNLKLNDFTIGDDRATSPFSELLRVRGGKISQTPSVTSAHILIENISVSRYKTATGIGIHLTNLSHVNLFSTRLPYGVDCTYGLVVDNDEQINTGVMNMSNCYIAGGETAMVIDSNLSLIDSLNINACFFGNREATLNTMKEVIVFNGLITSVSFQANHIEMGGASAYAAVKFTNDIQSFGFSNNNFSANTVDQTTYGVKFDDATVKGSVFESNNFLRFESHTTGGALYRIENNCIFDETMPNRFGTEMKSNGNSKNLDVEAGGNEDLIWSGILADPLFLNRTEETITTDSSRSFEPKIDNGTIQFLINNNPNLSGIVMYKAGSSPVCVAMGAGSNFDVSTSVLTGTTGTSGKVTVSAAADGLIYIENRSAFSITAYISPLTMKADGT